MNEYEELTKYIPLKPAIHIVGYDSGENGEFLIYDNHTEINIYRKNIDKPNFNKEFEQYVFYHEYGHFLSYSKNNRDVAINKYKEINYNIPIEIKYKILAEEITAWHFGFTQFEHKVVSKYNYIICAIGSLILYLGRLFVKDKKINKLITYCVKKIYKIIFKD